MLFVYGTLLDPCIQQKVIGRIVKGKADLLQGYHKKMKRFSDGVFPVITSDPDGIVEGCVIELTSDELSRCDKYEGSEYHRIKISLRSGIEAWTYTI